MKWIFASYAELPDRCHDYLNRLNQRLLVETSPLVRNQRGNYMAIMSVFQTEESLTSWQEAAGTAAARTGRMK